MTFMGDPMVDNSDALERDVQQELLDLALDRAYRAEKECAELRLRLSTLERWKLTPDLALSCNLDEGTLRFGALPFAVVGEDDPECRREAGVAIYNQLVDLQREIWTLRCWKRRTDEWIAWRPPE